MVYKKDILKQTNKQTKKPYHNRGEFCLGFNWERTYTNFILIRSFSLLSLQGSVMNFLEVQIPRKYTNPHGYAL